MKLLENKEKFCFKMVTTKNIKSLLQKVKTKKPVVIYFIPFKLVKVAAEPPSQTPIEAMKKNMCIQQNNFPNNAKVAHVLPLGKDKLNKCDMSNFRAVSVLKNFSNI